MSYETITVVLVIAVAGLVGLGVAFIRKTIENWELYQQQIGMMKANRQSTFVEQKPSRGSLAEILFLLMALVLLIGVLPYT